MEARPGMERQEGARWPSAAGRTQDAANPFTRLAEHGIEVDVPPMAEVPQEPVVRNLLTMWSRVVGASR